MTARCRLTVALLVAAAVLLAGCAGALIGRAVDTARQIEEVSK